MRGLPPPIDTLKERKVKGNNGPKSPARGVPLSLVHGIRAPSAGVEACVLYACAKRAIVAFGAHVRARSGRGAGHKNPASAVSGPYGPMDTCGYMSGYEREGREPGNDEFARSFV